MHRLQVPRGAPPLTGSSPGIPRGAAVATRRGPFLVAAAAVAADQATKAWAVAALSDGPLLVAGETLQLRLTRNPGGAFSLFSGFTPVLTVLAAVLAVVIVGITRRTVDRPTAWSLGLVLGGAVGNLVDRLVRDPGLGSGRVVDFIDLSFWPSFNLADSAITIGVAVLVIRGWRQ